MRKYINVILGIGFILSVAVIRCVGVGYEATWACFTPIGAMAIFGGAIFHNNKWAAVLFPLTTLFISDVVINLSVYNGAYGVMYTGWYWTYLAFAFIVFLGYKLRHKFSVLRFIGTSFVAAFAYWLIVDFGVWAGRGMDISTGLPLTPDLKGLVTSYVQGIPFIKNFLMGTLVYGIMMFGTWGLVRSLTAPLVQAEEKNV